MSTRRSKVLEEVCDELGSQDEKWGEQNHPSGTGADVPTHYFMGPRTMGEMAKAARDLADARARRGKLTYLDILLEEVFEAAAEDDPGRLRAELIQAAAVAVAFVEKIDRDHARVLSAALGEPRD